VKQGALRPPPIDDFVETATRLAAELVGRVKAAPRVGKSQVSGGSSGAGWARAFEQASGN
jgi:hypothetical protein